MEIVRNVALISINETLIIQLVSFLIFLFLINRIMFRPLKETIGERDRHILDLNQGIQTSEQQIKDLNTALRDEERQAVDEAHRHKNNLEEDGDREAKEIMEVSRKEILALKNEKQRYIDAQISRARQTLQQESQTLAEQIMEKILDRRLTK